jgi:hypothetical protein
MLKPNVVRFSGLEVEATKLLEGRLHKGVIPIEWIRLVTDSFAELSIDKLNRWLYKNIEGKWACYIIYRSYQNNRFFIAFEKDTDAVMFRLKGGVSAIFN